jgi:hypothetical protein
MLLIEGGGRVPLVLLVKLFIGGVRVPFVPLVVEVELVILMGGRVALFQVVLVVLTGGGRMVVLVTLRGGGRTVWLVELSMVVLMGGGMVELVVLVMLVPLVWQFPLCESMSNSTKTGKILKNPIS